MKTTKLNLRVASIILSVVGLTDSIYLAVLKLTGNRQMCLEGLGDCWTVNTSRYASLFGIPISLLGAGAYLLILALLLLEHRSGRFHLLSPVVIFGLTLTGLVYSIYLTYLEVAVLKAICPFCVLSAVVMLLLFGIAIARLTQIQAEII